MKKAILLIPVLGGIILQAQAQGFKIGLQGQRQTGMALTGVGYLTGASAIYFNPGALSFIDRSNVEAGVTALIPKTEFVDGNTQNKYYTDSQVFPPFNVYGAYKINKKLAAGIGAYTPFGSGLRWQENWSGRFILHEIELQSVFIQPTVSYQLTDKLGIGIGGIYALGKVTLSKDIPVNNSQGNYPRATLTGNAHNFGFNAGVFYKLCENFSAGITYHSRIDMKIDNGDARFTGMPASLQSQFPNTTFNTTLPLPSELSAGIGYRPIPPLLLALDVSYTFFHSYDTLAFDYKQNTPTLQDSKSPRDYKDVPAFKLGAQYTLCPRLDIRGGVFYAVTPVQQGYSSPELPDNNRIGLTCGLSYRPVKQLSIDLSFLYENVQKRTDTNMETQLYGTYKTYVFAPGIGVGYSF